MTLRTPARLLHWRPMPKNSLLGFAQVQFSSGLIISEIAVHRSGSRMWATPPARPWVASFPPDAPPPDKPRYQPIITFANHGVQASWSRQVLTALRAEQPDLFGDQILELKLNYQ